MHIPPFWCGVGVGFIGCMVLVLVMAVMIGSNTNEDDEE